MNYLILHLTHFNLCIILKAKETYTDFLRVSAYYIKKKAKEGYKRYGRTSDNTGYRR